MKKPKKNWLEWGVFACSLGLILATAGLLIHEHFSLGQQPADPQVQLGTPETHKGYFAVPLTIVNRGDATAESVQVQVELQLPDGEIEKGEVQLQYLPRHATSHAWVTFLRDPREGKLTTQVRGYEEP